MTEPLITESLVKKPMGSETLIKGADAVAPNQYFDHVLPKMVGDRRIRIDISRNTLIAIVISIILHAIILFVVLPKPNMEPPAGVPPPIEVSLAPPPVVVPPEIIPEEVVEPDVPKVIAQKPRPNRKPEFTVPDTPEPPKVEPVKPKVEQPPMDMAEMIRRNQAKKYGEEYDAARQNSEAAASENGMTESQKRDERIAKNLNGGAGGIFSSPNIRGRYATFNFNGWVNGLGNQRQQYFEVEAQPGQDVRLLVIQRMISFIRESYPGDFPWDSQRLGKVVTLSARPQDSAELENFLMVEFYGKDFRTNF